MKIILTKFHFQFVSVYRVPLAKCLNVSVNDEGLVICIGKNCQSILGSKCTTIGTGQVLLSGVREVLYRPLGSFIQGTAISNINTCRLMYSEILEHGSFDAPRTFLDIPQHTIEPKKGISNEGNIVQVSSRDQRECKCANF